MKKVIKAIASLLLISFTVANTALAEIPNGTVVIGDKGFSLSYANDESNATELRDVMRSLDEDGRVFIKTPNGKWYNNDGSLCDAAEIPQVLFRNVDGTIVTYASGDGEELISGIQRVAFLDDKTLEVALSGEKEDKDLEEFVQLGDDYAVKSVKLSKDKKKVTLELEKSLENNPLIVVKINGVIKSTDGKEMNINSEKKIRVITEKTYEAQDDSMEDMNIVADDAEISNIEVKGNLFINPGKGGNAELNKVTANRVVVLSGADHSIKVDESKIQNLVVDSVEKTRVMITGETVIANSRVLSEAILESDGTSSFKNTVLENNAELEGNFGKIEVSEEKVQVKILDGSKISELALKDDTKIEAEGTVTIDKIDASEAKTEEIQKIIEAPSTPVIGGGGGGGFMPPKRPLDLNLDSKIGNIKVYATRVYEEVDGEELAEVKFTINVLKRHQNVELLNSNWTIIHEEDSLGHNRKFRTIKDTYQYTLKLKKGTNVLRIKVPLFGVEEYEFEI